MGTDSQTKIEQRVVWAAETALTDRHVVTSIDVLVGIGWLSLPLVEDWRRGRIPYLEHVVGANLHTITTAMRYFRHWADQRGLAPSEAACVAWTRDRHHLRFSKGGDPTIERLYRTHWVSRELMEAKRRQRAERQRTPPESGAEASACAVRAARANPE